MADNPLKSLTNYSRFVAELLHRSTVERSTVAVWSDSRYTGVAEGEVFFTNGIRLRLREELDFDAGLIAAYGYEVYRGAERLYWYDDLPIHMTQNWPPRFLTTSMCPRISSITVFLRRR